MGKPVKKFWAVSAKYFDSGRVKVNLYPVEAESTPESGMTEKKTCDYYIDYFNTYEDALAWYEQSKKA